VPAIDWILNLYSDVSYVYEDLDDGRYNRLPILLSHRDIILMMLVLRKCDGTSGQKDLLVIPKETGEMMPADRAAAALY
jgi:hypothetical protein